MQKLQSDFQKIALEGDNTQEIQAAGKAMNRDLEMVISVRINPVHETPNSGATAFPPPAGAFSAARWNTSSAELDQGDALVLFGQWARNAQGRWQPVRRPKIDFESLLAALAR